MKKEGWSLLHRGASGGTERSSNRSEVTQQMIWGLEPWILDWSPSFWLESGCPFLYSFTSSILFNLSDRNNLALYRHLHVFKDVNWPSEVSLWAQFLFSWRGRQLWWWMPQDQYHLGKWMEGNEFTEKPNHEAQTPSSSTTQHLQGQKATTLHSTRGGRGWMSFLTSWVYHLLLEFVVSVVCLEDDKKIKMGNS